MSENEDEISRHYKVVNPPHVHLGFDKNELMLKTFLLMSMIAFASVMVMGVPALFHILIALGVVLVVHGTIDSYQKWKETKPTYDSPTSPLVAGMIVGLCMPIAAPYLATAAVAFLTMFVFKYVQGKYFDHKYLNPAATSKSILFLTLAFVFRAVDPDIAARIYHPHHQELRLLSTEGFNDAMWIFRGKTIPLVGEEVSATQGLFFWQTHGWIGGASGVV
ncbi:MAG: RnfABCDGE type electron transport complex subunit D, partial [Candidatus Natronoplasma sp.]